MGLDYGINGLGFEESQGKVFFFCYFIRNFIYTFNMKSQLLNIIDL